MILLKKSQNLFLSVVFLFYIVSINSCIKNKEFGLEVDPESSSVNAIYCDTFSLVSFSVISDSINTDELNGPSPLGNYIDPVFGEVNAAIITQIRIEQAYDFKPINGTINDIVVDSVVMYLAIDGNYGEIEKQEFIVEILDEDIFKDSTYNNKTFLNTKSVNLSESGSIKSDPLFPGYFAGILVESYFKNSVKNWRIRETNN